ncbi:MAG: tetratricopeptide repeat protein [Bacteroidales bacterium]
MKRIGLILFMLLAVIAVNAQDGTSPSELKNAGNEAYRNKDYAKALENYEKAIAAWDKETDKTMIYATAVCAYKTQSYDKALKYFDMSIAENFKASNCTLYKSVVLEKQSKGDEALTVLKEGVIAYPEDTKLKSRLTKKYNTDANKIFEEGQQIVNTAIADATAGKFTTEDAKYTSAMSKGKAKCKEAKEALKKTYEVDPDNATAKKIDAAIDQILNL